MNAFTSFLIARFASMKPFIARRNGCRWPNPNRGRYDLGVHLANALALAAIAACSPKSAVDVRVADDGSAIITCGARAPDCVNAAHDRCRAGFLVLDDAGKPVAASFDHGATEIVGGRLRVRCVSSAIAEPAYEPP